MAASGFMDDPRPTLSFKGYEHVSVGPLVSWNQTSALTEVYTKRYLCALQLDPVEVDSKNRSLPSVPKVYPILITE